MQPEYIALLSDDGRALVLEVEAAAELALEVVPDARLTSGGPLGPGKPMFEVDSGCARISAPADGYFSDGAVRHEVLHVCRFHL